MSNESFQTLCNVGIAACVIFGALFTYGTFHYGKLIDNEKEAKAAEAGKLSYEKSVPPKTMKLQWGESAFISDLRDGYYPLDYGDGTSIMLRAVDNEIVLTADFYDFNGNLVARLVDNEWKLKKETHWDRNYTKEVLEVIDNSGGLCCMAKLNHGARTWAYPTV